MPTNELETNTVVYDMDGTLFSGDCGAAFIKQRINGSIWRLLLAIIIAPLAFPMMRIAQFRKIGVSAYLWVASVGVDETAYSKALDDFITQYRIKPVHNVLAECRKDIIEGRKVVIATGAGRELTNAFMKQLDLYGHVHLVTSQSRRFFGGMISSVQCNGETKLQELIKHGHPPPYLRVYSDNAMDLPILRSTNKAYLVNYHEKDRKFLMEKLGEKLQLLDSVPENASV
ncbi:MAG: HAD family hydrolase [Arenimonas sp.]